MQKLFFAMRGVIQLSHLPKILLEDVPRARIREEGESASIFGAVRATTHGELFWGRVEARGRRLSITFYSIRRFNRSYAEATNERFYCHLCNTLYPLARRGESKPVKG